MTAPDGLVSRRAMLLAGAVFAVGLVLCGWSVFVISGRPDFADQVSPAAVAVVGLLLAGLGETIFLVGGRRAVTLRSRALLGDGTPVGAKPLGTSRSPGQLVAVEGLARYHRSDCAMVPVDGDLVVLDGDCHQATGRRPCRMCCR